MLSSRSKGTISVGLGDLEADSTETVCSSNLAEGYFK